MLRSRAAYPADLPRAFFAVPREIAADFGPGCREPILLM